MRRIRHGRGGWEIERAARLSRVGQCALLALALTVAACSSSKPASQGAGAGAGAGGAGMGEQNLANKGSLAQYQSGTLGANGAGPLTDIHFGYNDYTIQSQDGEVLRSNARWLADHANTHVQIEGHCDERGSEEYNLALGAKRAQAAKEYLTDLGISADRISTISYGKELPLCSEHTEECWAQNRRDHFVVSQVSQ
jgi:peptidoglycan-associated lipoprotein